MKKKPKAMKKKPNDQLLTSLNSLFGDRAVPLPVVPGVTPDQLAEARFTIHPWLHSYPHIQVRGFYRVKDGTTYTHTRPGCLVVIKHIFLDLYGRFSTEEGHNVHVLALDENGRLLHPNHEFKVDVEHLDPLSPEEVQKIEEMWAAPVAEPPPYNDGTVVTLSRDTTLEFRTWANSVVTQLLPKGMCGVVDTPQVNRGKDMDDANRTEYVPPSQEVEFGWRLSNPLSSQFMNTGNAPTEVVNFIDAQEAWFTPSFQHQKVQVPLSGHGWKYNVYFPEMAGYATIDHSTLQAYEFDRQAMDRLVLPKIVKQKLRAAGRGQKADPFGLKNMKRSSNGRYILAFGDAGLGKSASARALSEVLEVPLVTIDAQTLGNTPEDFEWGLTKALERAVRWGAIVLWDEVETYLGARRPDGSTNRQAATALTLLEKFPVTMVMTTNKANELDGAILSRCGTRLWYAPFTKEDRAKVIRLKVSTEIVPDLESVIDELSALNLTGRDIEMNLRNAADIAVDEGLSTVPANYLLEEARYMVETNVQIHGADQHTFGVHNQRRQPANTSNGASLHTPT